MAAIGEGAQVGPEEPTFKANDESIPPPRFALWSDGTFEVRICDGLEFRLNPDEFTAMLDYINGVSLTRRGP